jgi:isopenicillin N synthase-like dioxygenase
VPDTAYYRQPFAATAFEPNIVPDMPEGFAEIVRGYYRSMESLTLRLLRIFAGALNVDRDFFVEFFNHHTSVMRIINYPDQSGMTVDAGQTRSGAHTDYGALTILLAEKAPGGLQVKAQFVHHQYRRPDGDVDQRSLGVQPAPGGQPAGRQPTIRAPAVDCLFCARELRRLDPLHTDMHRVGR